MRKNQHEIRLKMGHVWSAYSSREAGRIQLFCAMQWQWGILSSACTSGWHIHLERRKGRAFGSIFCDHDNENTRGKRKNTLKQVFSSVSPLFWLVSGEGERECGWEGEGKSDKFCENFHWFHCQGRILARARRFHVFPCFSFRFSSLFMKIVGQWRNRQRIEFL
jgi:hypothetical protein